MRFWLNLVLIALLIVVQYRLWITPSGLGRSAELEKKIEAQKLENEQLEARNQVVTEEIEALINDEGLEEAARSKLGLIAEGETFYVTPEDL